MIELLIPFFAGAAFMLACVLPAFIGLNRSWTVRLLEETNREFNRGYELGWRMNRIFNHSPLAKKDELP